MTQQNKGVSKTFNHITKNRVPPWNKVKAPKKFEFDRLVVVVVVVVAKGKKRRKRYTKYTEEKEAEDVTKKNAD